MHSCFAGEKHESIEVTHVGTLTSHEYPLPYLNGVNMSWSLHSPEKLPILLEIIGKLHQILQSRWKTVAPKFIYQNLAWTSAYYEFITIIIGIKTRRAIGHV